MSVHALCLLLAVHNTVVNDQERAHVTDLARQAQYVTWKKVKLAFADQDYTEDTAAQAAHEEGTELQFVVFAILMHILAGLIMQSA